MSKARSADAKPGGYDIFIRNLLEDTRAGTLAQFFKDHVGDAGRVIRPPRLALARGFAWITFDTLAAVREALKLSGSYYSGRLIYVHAANNVSGADETFADLHLPALCEETVTALVVPDPNGVYVDGTFGRGGHTRAILKALSPKGRLHAFDMDPEAIKVGKKLMEEDARFTVHHAPFSSMIKVLKSVGVEAGSVAGVLLDVGISSPQFNDKSRGFRPEADGPLDLRFDTSKGMPASEFLSVVPHAELVRIIDEYGEESGGGAASRRIVDAICLARTRGDLPTRTKEFAELVARAKGKESSGQQMHPAKMTFQALRIYLNDEFGEMRRGMKAAFELVGEGGRIALITWKFSERKIVDEIFNMFEAVRSDEPLLEWYRRQPNAEKSLPKGPSLENDEVIRPSERELKMNSRSRQGLLHVLRKVNHPRLADLETRAYAMPEWADVVAPRPQTSAVPVVAAATENGGEKKRKRHEEQKDEKKEKKEKKDKKDKKEKKEKKEKKRGKSGGVTSMLVASLLGGEATR